MDTSKHDLHSLFLQLGLPAQREAIDEFIESHRSLQSNIPLHCAGFWNKSQAEFLREAIADDSDWCELVEALDVCLRQ